MFPAFENKLSKAYLGPSQKLQENFELPTLSCAYIRKSHREAQDQDLKNCQGTPDPLAVTFKPLKQRVMFSTIHKVEKHFTFSSDLSPIIKRSR